MHHFPDDVFIHVQIIVNNAMAHTNDFSPGNLWMGRLKFFRYLLRCFPNHLNEVCQSQAKNDILIVI